MALTLPLSADGVLAAASKNQSNLSNISNAVSTATSNSGTYNMGQISSAANSVTEFYGTNKRLPNYVTISNQQVSMPQFLYLLASGTSQIGSEGSTVTIPVKNINSASSPVENITPGNIQRSEYVTIANNLKNFIDTNGRLPNYINTSLGKMRYESAVFMFSKILNFYNTNHRTPNYVSVTNWAGQGSQEGNNTSNGQQTISQAQLIEAASSIKSYVDKYHVIPNYVTVAGQQLTIPQFLQLLARGLININSGDTSGLTIVTINPATMPVENVMSGKINKSEVLNLALSLINYTNTNNRIPNNFNTTLGQMRYESTLYMFLKVFDFYNTNHRLPNYVSIVPWAGNSSTGTDNGLLRPVYIISDNINNLAYDNARIDAIVSELGKLGVTAYNYGAGTDNYAIFPMTPGNALIVQINGGVCAGTIKDMGSAYYKDLVGTREVFMVFTEGATKITGLDWMPRAHDDNFSPASFTGLANPDQYLLNNGYHYYEGLTMDKISELAQILYNEAIS